MSTKVHLAMKTHDDDIPADPLPRKYPNTSMFAPNAQAV
jgi:hypothetical protein